MSDIVPKNFTKSRPDGDTHAREVCDRCGFVDYQNPKIVVGSVVTHDGKYLLCRRAIEPRYGFWTIPAGYLELGESPQEGAKREAREEANAALELHELLAVYTVRHLSQVQLIYRASLIDDVFSAGDETLECGLFSWDEIPWDALAFPTVHWMLNHHRDWENGRLVLPVAQTSEESL